MKIIIKVRYFMANFGHKVRTIIVSYLGVNAAATSAADENSQGKRQKDSDTISFPSWSRFCQEQSMFAVTISSLSNGSLTMIWHLDPINLLKLSLSDKFLVTSYCLDFYDT